jgi:1-deoxyxylulose-5-phosphate synthase
MRNRLLGRTGLTVSEVSLGTVELGMDYGISVNGDQRRPTVEEAANLLHRALDLGINLLDTARAYGDSEEIIGRAVAGRRNDFVLVTKVQTFRNLDLSASERRPRMEASIEQSLANLRTETVDLLLLHTSGPGDIYWSQYSEVLADAKRRGAARFIGASVYGNEAALSAIPHGAFDCLQIAWSAMDRRAEDQVLSEATASQVGLMVRSVLMRGALSHRWRSLPEALDPVRAGAAKLEALAGQAGITLPELAYRYVLSSEGPLTALVGTSRISELEATIAYAEAGPLSSDLLEAIRAVDIEDPSFLDLSRWPAV